MKSNKPKKPKKRVEYRWFPWHPSAELLGGVVAPDPQTAFYGLSGEERIHVLEHGYNMVRVRMEYEMPPVGKTRE